MPELKEMLSIWHLKMDRMDVVVDEQLATGWKDCHKLELAKRFNAIRAVGEDPKLPLGIKDKPLASFCKRENSVLLTCDRKVYVDFFVDGRETIRIQTYGVNEESGQTIYMLTVA